MKITVNGTQQSISEALTLRDVIRRTEGVEDRDGIAVAVNDDVISRSEWDNYKVSDGDRIEIIQAVQGG